jgi:hypothetical protein
MDLLFDFVHSGNSEQNKIARGLISKQDVAPIKIVP